jgi:hypothetical protein
LPSPACTLCCFTDSILRIEAIFSSETLIYFQQITQRFFPEDNIYTCTVSLSIIRSARIYMYIYIYMFECVFVVMYSFVPRFRKEKLCSVPSYVFDKLVCAAAERVNLRSTPLDLQRKVFLSFLQSDYLDGLGRG